jgi:3-hydroxyisobutyrate dehydrogenase-like beta-hydroxyacid dehydrogenase
MIDAARGAGLDLPLSKTHCRLLELAEEAGYGEADNSAVIQAYGAMRRGRSES